MEVRSALVAIVNAIGGKWVVAAAHLGMTENSLRNRVYEVKGQSLSTSDALILQELSGTVHFAEAIAQASGGTFNKLPDLDQLDNDSVHAEFNKVYQEVALCFHEYQESMRDDEIDTVERKNLEEHFATLHRKIDTLKALMFAIGCRRNTSVKLQPVGEEVANG